MKKNYIIITLVFAVFCVTLKAANTDEIMKAMRDEINRSMNELHLESLQKPYYIEYTLKIYDSYHITSALGTITNSANDKKAELNVNFRVGDYSFDNTNFFDISLGLFGSTDEEENFKNRPVPYEIDYKSLRRELWLASDAAYKQASEILSKKIATLKNKTRKDSTPDFIKLAPEKNYDTISIPSFNVNKFEELCRNVSSKFNTFKNLQISYVGLEYIPETVYYANSEGREFIKTNLYSGIEIIAATQADDGMPLYDMYSAYSKSPYELPREDSLMRAAFAIAENLTLLEKSPILEETYSGPVLFEDNAAAELFAQVFAPNLVLQRSPMTESGVQESDRYTAFQNKLGGRVLPEFLSVNAEPNKTYFDKTPLLGSFKIDDEGVLAQPVNLVKDGYLKNLLSSRIPSKRVHTSNGHKRGGAAMLSVIEMSSDKKHSKSHTELINQMLKLCKDRELPFGIIVKKAANQNIFYTTLQRIAPTHINMNFNPLAFNLIQVYKVYNNGKEELVRGCDANSFTAQSFKDILNVGNKSYVLNLLAPSITSPYITGGELYVGSSVISPSLLFEDGEIKVRDDDFPNKPYLPNPLTEIKSK
ncbi:MAG: metallopeptidase TldD-related protein [Bacteroidetes bacterium]|nr:metallopeptidase TldD-related protein [Bacteroidota bacterium]